MAKSFSEDELAKIKRDLQVNCEKSWRLRGYKRTNIPLLTKAVGISTGAFYLIYKKKEDLFVDVLRNIQQNLLDTWSHFLEQSDKKIDGFKEGLLWLFKEYHRYPNLYDVNNPEYDLFLAKLPEEEIMELKTNSITIFRIVIKNSKLKLLLSEEEVIDIIHAILFLAFIERDTVQRTERTFNFLVENTLGSLFQEEN